MKKRLPIILITCLALLPFSGAKAIVPVTDYAALVAHYSKLTAKYESNIQDLTDYIESLINSAEQKLQTSKQIAMLAQMIKDYNQVMAEYAHLKNQMRDLKKLIKDPDWVALTGTVAKGYGAGDFALTALLDPNSSNYATNLNTILKETGLSSYSSADYVKAYKDIGLKDTGGVKRSADYVEKVFEKYSNQQQQVAVNNKNIVTLEAMRAKNVNTLKGLGSESELATLQFIAAQQAFAAEQALVQMNISNQILQAYEPDSAKRARTGAAGLAKELQKQAIISTHNYKGTGINANDLGL